MYLCQENDLFEHEHSLSYADIIQLLARPVNQ